MPVFGSNQCIYRNSFCARCNLLKQFKLVNLTANCKARKGEYVSPYQRFINCSFKVPPTENVTNYIKTCNRNTFDKQSTCNKTNKYHNICLSYLGVVGNSANYHCLTARAQALEIPLKINKVCMSKIYSRKV